MSGNKSVSGKLKQTKCTQPDVNTFLSYASQFPFVIHHRYVTYIVQIKLI